MLLSESTNSLQLLGLASTRAPQLPSKRKREEICQLGTFTQPFAIKPHPQSPYDRPAIFKPVRVIGRAQLPLTFLDTSPDENFTANSLFSAQISILEQDEGENKDIIGSPKALIARYDTKRALYAIERVRPRVYSICRLASWLKEKDVADLWDPSNAASYPGITRSEVSVSGDGQWWQHAVVESKPVEPPAKRARVSMMRRPLPVEPAKEENTPRYDTPVQQDTDNAHITSFEEQGELIHQLPSPQEQLAALLEQYLDAVYLSKTSLAYFAKGPITRIRNTFTSPEEGAPPTHELVTFLKSMLLSPKASDKKYHEKLPAVIKALPPGSFSDDEPAAGNAKARKSKKKMKLSRDGVYPHEEIAIRKWWNMDTPTGDNANETIDQRIRRRIGDLRVRETLAQMIIMLEIIALEALAKFNPPSDTSVPDESQTQGESQVQPKKRKKSLDDIGLQLDLLLDKLCIWHVTEEQGILDFDTKPGQQLDDMEGTGKNGGSDRLRGFCLEVIIPFYMNRLQEQALMINKRLGGPAHASPPKRKAMKPPTTSRKSGEPKEPDAKKSRRSLGRVATDTTGRPVERAKSSLSRSFTDPALMHRIKREGSEVSLSAIPFQRSPSKNARRSMSQFRQLESREVDLTTPSAAMTAKLKQKQRVVEDLQEAITAIKKPNRGLAAGGYIDEMERRSQLPVSKSRKQPNPTRKVVKDVQVSATPRLGQRTRDAVKQTPDHSRPISNPFARLVAAGESSSSELFIPSSSGRQSSLVVPGTAHRSATGRNLGQSSVAETPSKAPNTKTFDSGAARRTIFATPLKPMAATKNQSMPGTSHVFESPGKVVGSSPPSMGGTSQAAVFATPTKSVGTLIATQALSNPFSKEAKEDAKEEDIYAALGWDDE